jgi:hypothetical protein
MGGILGWVVGILVIVLLSWVSVEIDWWMNQSWLNGAFDNWAWYNYFTSAHGDTYLFERHLSLWWGVNSIVAAVMSGFVFLRGSD